MRGTCVCVCVCIRVCVCLCVCLCVCCVCLFFHLKSQTLTRSFCLPLPSPFPPSAALTTSQRRATTPTLSSTAPPRTSPGCPASTARCADGLCSSPPFSFAFRSLSLSCAFYGCGGVVWRRSVERLHCTALTAALRLPQRESVHLPLVPLCCSLPLSRFYLSLPLRSLFLRCLSLPRLSLPHLSSNPSHEEHTLCWLLLFFEACLSRPSLLHSRIAGGLRSWSVCRPGEEESE